MDDHELGTRVAKLLLEHDPATEDQVTFRGAQFDAGLAWVHFPEGRGGLGLERSRQGEVDELLRNGGVRYHDLNVNPMGIGMAAPTLLRFGSEAHLDRHLRPIFTGEDIWCQLFSEPSHGSDVAGIPSRAEHDGDEWVVNGQKVWTTLAHAARFGLLLTRTDPSVPKHRGLSYFVLDMHSPGVVVRPLYQLTGEAEFNEVFLDGVRVAASSLLGEVGDGWRVATATLMNERSALGGSRRRGGGPVRHLHATWREASVTMPEGQRVIWRDRVVALHARAEVLRLTNERARAAAGKAGPGPEGAVGKLMAAELSRDVHAACVDLRGASGMLHPAGYPMARSLEEGVDPGATGRFLRSRANTIEGGTSEIMRTLLGERVLGLPAEPATDKALPWSEIPR